MARMHQQVSRQQRQDSVDAKDSVDSQDSVDDKDSVGPVVSKDEDYEVAPPEGPEQLSERVIRSKEQPFPPEERWVRWRDLNKWQFMG